MTGTDDRARKKSPPSRTADQFVVRFPDGMRPLIETRAKKNNRSMNAEIVGRLEDSFEERPPLSDTDVERIAVRLAQLLKSQ